MSEQFDYLFKLLIVGDANVGKSSLLLRFADDIYMENLKSTILDFKIRTVEMDGKIIKLNIWDTAGSERFQCLIPSQYKGAHGVILVYDCTQKETFKNIQRWLQNIEHHAGTEISKLLVGNKTDLTTERVIDYFTAKKYAGDLGMTFIETSAKNAENVEQAFMTMVAQIKERIEPLLSTCDTSPSLTLHDSKPVDSSCGYC